MALFGTDGIREIFGQGVFTNIELRKLTLATIKWLKNKKVTSKIILLGRDTRSSGIKIQKILVDIFKKMGFYPLVVNVVPTQILSYFSKTIKPSLTIAITASHNPAQYNGLKFINTRGLKISEVEEKKIEKIYRNENADLITNLTNLSSLKKKHLFHSTQYSTRKLFNSYLENSVEPLSIGKDTTNFKIVLDCANGATYKIAPLAFKKAGYSNLLLINNSPDGSNINLDCGVVNVEKSIEYLQKKKVDFDFFILFDGDGDRVHIVDRTFKIYNGDTLLAIYAYYYKVIKQQKLDKVVGTIMSNMGLEKFCKEIKVDFLRTAVGDRNVTLKVMKEKTFLGGEPSGHIVNLKINSLGDGILNSLLFLKIVSCVPEILKLISLIYRPFKSYQLNIKIKEKIPLDSLPLFTKKIAHYNENKNLRVVVRYSGTENVLRVMIESDNEHKCIKIARQLRDLYNSEIERLLTSNYKKHKEL
ncbi:MAG: hypothetical protein ACK4NF_00985 [Planctomycetota bacterium]